MPRLDFPNETFALHLKPAATVGAIRGTITLRTVDAVDEVVIDVGPDGMGTAAVTYSSNSADSGEIGPFDVNVTKADGTVTVWKFGGAAVTETGPRLVYVTSNSVMVGSAAAELAGIPSNGAEPPPGRMGVRLGGSYIGDLMVIDIFGLRLVMFHPRIGRPVPAVVNGDTIQWTYGRKTFSGYRFAFSGAGLEQGYAGLAIGELILSGNDWEATAGIPFELEADAPMAGPTLPFPEGDYRMMIATPRDAARGMPEMMDRCGVCTLTVEGGNYILKIQSGSQATVPAIVSYPPAAQRYGKITVPEMTIGTEVWRIGTLTAFRIGNLTYLFGGSIQIGTNTATFSAFPAGALPFVGKHFLVSRPTVQAEPPLGDLFVLGMRDAEFQDNAGAKAPADIFALTHVRWAAGGNGYYGISAVLEVDLAGAAPKAVFGYRGYRKPVSSARVSDNDWEATGLPVP